MSFLGALDGAIGVMGGSIFTTLFTRVGRLGFYFSGGELFIEANNAIWDSCNPGVNFPMAVGAQANTFPQLRYGLYPAPGYASSGH
jgi:hypothetical protein